MVVIVGEEDDFLKIFSMYAWTESLPRLGLEGRSREKPSLTDGFQAESWR